MFHALWQVPVSVLRVAMVYGPGQPDTTKLVPYVTLSLLRGQDPELTSGARMVTWVYVEDVVDAFILAGADGAAAGHVLDIGTARAGVHPRHRRTPHHPGERHNGRPHDNGRPWG